MKKIIDETLDKMAKEEILMKKPDPNMPKEMLDLSIPQDDDWKPWKPIESTFSNSDIDKIEQLIGIELPLSYRELLMYKHFYELDIPDYAVNFHQNLPDKNLEGFKETFFEYYDSEFLIKKGLIYFADFQDYGLLCFDSNEKRENNEYPIVYVDHEELTTKHHYSDNLKELMLADRERGNRFIMELNEYNRKQ
ncbi:SMI1/KNR4 family protein [Tenacibaculum sp. MEBiC06402]|uniref:SMI1/KNR4 family protein n=1 Tax=unclassified Tenacibaculum TaxID=2635139 RepID=UPI003B9B9DE8